MRVGLLEDDVAIQEMLLLVLEDEGYTVMNFTDAEECQNVMLNAGEAGKPIPVDLMIVDWRLSGSASGIEVIRHLRKNPHLQALPIILTTAATFSDTEELQNLHVELLEKPFSVDDMTDLIKKVTRP